MDKIDQNNIKALRQFFNTSVAIFEMKHTISESLGNPSPKSYMHTLHVSAQKEINKEIPSLEKMYKLLYEMEELSNKNS